MTNNIHSNELHASHKRLSQLQHLPSTHLPVSSSPSVFLSYLITFFYFLKSWGCLQRMLWFNSSILPNFTHSLTHAHKQTQALSYLFSFNWLIYRKWSSPTKRTSCGKTKDFIPSSHDRADTYADHHITIYKQSWVFDLLTWSFPLV